MHINGTPVEMMFTSVSGHLMELDFAEPFSNWRACSPVDLYNASVTKRVPEVGICIALKRASAHTSQSKRDIQNNLQQLARQANWLVLWLDCDREGENIAYEVRLFSDN